MSLPKVLLVTFESVPSPDGKAVRVESIVRALQGRYDVDLLTPRVGDLPHIEIRWSARVLRVPLGRGHLHAQLEAFARAVRRQLQSEDYRLVHLFDPRVAGPACELAEERNFRIVFEPLGVPLLDLERVFPAVGRNTTLVERLRAAEAMCVASAHAIVVSTEIARAHISALAPIGERVHLVPGCVDLTATEPARGLASGPHAPQGGRPSADKALSGAAGSPLDGGEPSDGIARATSFEGPRAEALTKNRRATRPTAVAGAAVSGVLSAEVSGDGPRGPRPVVYVGEVAPWQGVGTLLRALARLRADGKDVRCTLVGPHTLAHRDAVLALAKSLGVADVVVLAEPVAHTEIAIRLRQAEICVVPTELDERARRFGPFPLKLAEAFAAGVPCVASDVPAHLELAPPPANLLRYFPHGDADALAAQVAALLASPGTCATTAARALAFARDSLSFARFRERLAAVYGATLVTKTA